MTAFFGIFFWLMRTFIIIDGHHRFWVLKLLGAKPALVSFEDYFSDKVKVLSWRRGWSVVKKLVLEVGLSGESFRQRLTFQNSVKLVFDDAEKTLNITAKNRGSDENRRH